MNKKDKYVEPIFFMLLASSLLAGCTIISKILGGNLLGEKLNAFQISHSRFFFAFIVILILSHFLKLRLKKPKVKFHFYRAFCGWVGVSILFGVSSIIPVSDALAINFMFPVFAVMIAIPILNEKINLYGFILIIISFLGAIILIRPTFDLLEFKIISLISLFGALILGIESIFIKLLSQNEKSIQILFINNFFGLLLSSIPVYFFWTTPNLYQILLCFLIGLFMLGAQSCFIKALQNSKISYVSPFFYSSLIFVIIYDFFIFGTVPDLISLTGCSIIVFSGITFYLIKQK